MYIIKTVTVYNFVNINFSSTPVSEFHIKSIFDCAIKPTLNIENPLQKFLVITQTFNETLSMNNNNIFR